MTNTPETMAPARIWIDDERPIGGSCHVYNDEPQSLALKYVTEYVRADTRPAPVSGYIWPLLKEAQHDGRSVLLSPDEVSAILSALQPAPAVEGLRRALFEIGGMPGTEVGTIKARRIAAAALAHPST